jgi:hypothetical protein
MYKNNFIIYLFMSKVYQYYHYRSQGAAGLRAGLPAIKWQANYKGVRKTM